MRKIAKHEKTETDNTFYDTETVASATECTGLAPSAILDGEEAESYGELYSIHKPKHMAVGKNDKDAR